MCMRCGAVLPRVALYFADLNHDGGKRFVMQPSLIWYHDRKEAQPHTMSFCEGMANLSLPGGTFAGNANFHIYSIVFLFLATLNLLPNISGYNNHVTLCIS